MSRRGSSAQCILKSWQKALDNTPATLSRNYHTVSVTQRSWLRPRHRSVRDIYASTLRHKLKYLKNRWERIVRKLWLSFSRWRAEEKEIYFCSHYFFLMLFPFPLRNSITSPLPARDKATFDSLSKDTPEICGKDRNSTQPEVHS